MLPGPFCVNYRLYAKCNDVYVGAITDSSGMLATGKHCIINSLRGAPRLARECYEFALVFGEFGVHTARATNGRPYMLAITLHR